MSEHSHAGTATLPSDPVRLGLPHREPFIFVDAVIEHQPGDSAVGLKTFEESLPCFLGHFPGRPIVPGVYLLEAMAQTAGIAANSPDAPPRMLLLAAVRSVKFHSSAGPGAHVRLLARKTGETAGLLLFDVEAWESETMLASGSIILAESPTGSAP